MEGMLVEVHESIPPTWTDDRVTEAKSLWAQGKSAGQIANRFGVTRNVVIARLRSLGLLGKRGEWDDRKDKLLTELWERNISQGNIAKQVSMSTTAVRSRAIRLGLTPRQEPAPKKSERRQRRFNFAKLFDGITETVAEPPIEQRKTFFELEDCHCRWPFGDPRKSDFYFCGATKINGFSYCAAHLRLSMGGYDATHK